MSIENHFFQGDYGIALINYWLSCFDRNLKIIYLFKVSVLKNRCDRQLDGR